MAKQPTGIQAGESLADAIARRGPLEPVAAMRVVAQIAKTVQDLHQRSGVLHGNLQPEAIFLDESGQAHLGSPVRTIELGGTIPDSTICPPELQTGEPLILPVELENAAEILRARGLQFDPRRIDVYQMGTLLCYLLTAESVTGYLRSARTKTKVDPDIRTIIDSALGYDTNGRWQEPGPLIQAIKQHIGHEGFESDERLLENPSASSRTQSTESKSTDLKLSGANPPDTSPALKRNPGESSADLPFKYLGHFQILSRLGYGGMGDVYRAYEESLQRTVAVKVLPAELARQPDFVERFRAEATAAARLIHPNIVQIFYIGEDSGHHFFAMQFVDGEPLSTLLERRRKLSIRETISILEQVLLGLTAAHELGLVHRDIKPANILIDRKTGRALLADFGLVKSLEGTNRFTGTGIVMGTVDYISPEQARGQPVDSRSDLYSLGVLAYQMLTGKLPFVGDSVTSLIFQHVYEPPRPMRELAPEVPEPVAAIVHRLLAKSPADRPPSAGRVFEELQAFWTGREVKGQADQADIPVAELVAEPDLDEQTPASKLAEIDSIDIPNWEPPKTTWWRKARNRLLGRMQALTPELAQRMQNTQLLVSGAVEEYERRRDRLASVLKDGEVALANLEYHLNENREAAKQASLMAAEATDEASAQEAKTRESECLAAARELEARATEQREQLDSMQISLAEVNAKLLRMRSQRDALNARLKLARAQIDATKDPRSTRPRSILIAIGTGVVAAAVLATALAYLPDVLNMAGETVVDSMPGIKSRGTPPQMFSRGYDPATRHPDSRLVMTVADDSTVRSALPLRQFMGHEGRVNAVAFNPSGSLVASGAGDGTIRLWDPVTGLQIKKFDVDGATSVEFLAFSPDGRSLASAIRDSRIGHQIHIWNVATGETVSRMAPKSGVDAIAFAPHQRVLASLQRIGKEMQVRLWNYDDGTLLKVVFAADNTHSNMRPTLAYSPDGRYLAYPNSRYSLALMHVADGTVYKTIDARLPADLWERTGSGETNQAISFSADSKLIAVGARSQYVDRHNNLFHSHVQVFDIDTGELLGVFTSSNETKVNAIAFGPDAATLYVAGDKVIREWSVQSAAVIRTFGGQHTMAMAFDPNFRLMVSGGAPIFGPQHGPGKPYLMLWNLDSSS